MRKGKNLKASTKEALTGYLFALPWMAGFLAFTAGPIIYSFYLSFTNYNLYGKPKWIGFINYKEAFFQDPLFYKSLYNTLFMTVFSVPLGIAFGLMIALLLNQKVKGIRLFRTLFYMPNIVPYIVTALIWQWILDANFGLINTFLSYLGIEGPNWLGDPPYAKPALLLMGLWGVGGSMVIYLAGLQEIPSSLYESATIDGAGPVRKLFHITIPMLSPTIFFNMVMGIIGGFQLFLPAIVMTGNGGPANATRFYGYHLYYLGMHDLRMGYAAALGWILLVVTLIFTLLVLRSGSLWVYYEGDTEGGKV